MTDAEPGASRLYAAPMWRRPDPPRIADLRAGVLADVRAGYQRLAGRDATATVIVLTDRATIEGGQGLAGQDIWDSLRLSVHDAPGSGPGQPGAFDELWRAWTETGDVYIRRFTGWRCPECRQFYADHEIDDGPSCRRHMCSVMKVDADCWFFRLSDYRERLREFYDGVEKRTGQPFVAPDEWMTRIRGRLAGEVADIPLCLATSPPDHMPRAGDPDAVHAPLSAMAGTWAATKGDTTYVVPDDLVWFAGAVWPAMIMAANRPLPGGIIAYRATDNDRSRPPGGWLDLPAPAVAGHFSADALRYLLLRRPLTPTDHDVSAEDLIDCYNTELAKGLANLVARTTSLATDPDLAGAVPPPAIIEDPFDTDLLDRQAEPDVILGAVTTLVRAANTFLDERQPWHQRPADRAPTLWPVLELCRLVGHVLAPVLTERSRELLRQLGVNEHPHWPRWGEHRHTFHVGPAAEPLFAAVTGAQRKRLLREWQHQAQPRSEIIPEDFGRLDLRVARIAAVETIPSGEGAVLRLNLDLGGEQRVVFSTKLARCGSPGSLTGRMVVYLANLQPVEIAGFLSHGMVLAAEDEETTSLLAFDQTHEPGTVMF